MEKKISYGEALAEIEKILARFNDENLDVDTLTAQVKRATELIKLCKERLHKVEKEVGEILEQNKDEK